MITKNAILNVKYIFLNFVQALFSIDSVFTWDPDVQKTKIIIADRNAVDLGIAMLRPSIILQRGEMSWTYLIRGQDATNSIINYNDKSISSLAYPSNISDPANVKAYTDLLRGYVVFNVVSKNGIQAEILADKLFKNLTGYKDELRKSGIRQINNLTISQEQTIRGNSEIELIGVQVSLGFIQQLHIIKDEKSNICYVYDGENELFENHDYTVVENGKAILLREPAKDIITIDYTEAITLESNTGIVMEQDLTNNLKYIIPNNRAIAGYYILNSNVIVGTV